MKAVRKSERVTTALVVLWIVPGIAFLLLSAAAVLRQPGFHLSLGLIHATGTAALLTAAVPAGWGITSLVLLFRSRSLGARLLLVYCLFWLGDFLGGLLYNWEDVVSDPGQSNAPVSARIVVSLLMVGFLAGFAMCALWAWRRAELRS
jgi:hypothetical protein